MSDFWTKFKGAFIVEDPNQAQMSNEKPIQQSSQPVSQPRNAPVTPSVQTVYAAQNGGGAVNSKLMEALFGAMEKANLDGFDYFEFKQALANLANMPMDEATRYKSAFAMAQTMGATPAKLMDSAGHYLGILQQENDKFKQAVENQKQTQIGSKQSQIDNLEAVIKQKAEQIKKLTEEIDQHRQEMIKTKDDIAQSMVKVEQTQGDFSATYNSLIGQIQGDVSNMKKYLV